MCLWACFPTCTQLILLLLLAHAAAVLVTPHSSELPWSDGGSFQDCDLSRSMALSSRPRRMSRSGASTMELSVVTAEQQTSEGVRERLLLHWVNSLPLTKCLLVEELRDLRFGDVLHEIVKWLLKDFAQTEPFSSVEARDGDVFGNVAIAQRLRRVVQFVASECRSQDEDAMYLVNDGDCVDRVMAGNSDDICAVLTVLKRLSIQRLQEHQTLESEKVAMRHRRAQEEMIQHSLQQPRALTNADVKPKQKAKSTASSSSRQRRRVRSNVTTFSTAVEKDDSKGVKLHKKIPNASTKKRLNQPSSTAKSSAPKCIDNANVQPPTGESSGSGLQVFGVLEPTATYRPQGDTQKVNGSNESCEMDVQAARFCSWAQHFLQIEMPFKQIFAKRGNQWKLHPPRKVKQAFVSRVLLCRIAAGIVLRYGEQLDRRIPESKRPSYDDLASVTEPATPSERQRNVALALAVFRYIGVSPGALASFECLQQPGKDSSKSIWQALDEVLRKVSQLSHATTSSGSQEMAGKGTASARAGSEHEKAVVQRDRAEDHTSLKQVPTRRKKVVEMDAGLTGCASLKRNLSYITSEQMHVVNEWLLGLGFDVKKAVGRGVLQDPMRNGVILCTLVVQVLKSAPFPFCKTPRTLTEMRENISNAFEKLGDLPHESIPPCYLTTSAEQAVLIGDRQISYGLLWRIWQASCAARSLSQAKKGSELLPADLHETRKAESIGFGQAQITPVTSSPLLLDIPAIALAGQGKLAATDDAETSFQVSLHDTFARRLAWRENDAHGEEDGDDVFPVPKAPFSSPVYSEKLSSVPAETHEDDMKYQTVDDIFPAYPGRRRSHESFGQDLDQRPAPSIAIAELSAVAASSTLGKTAKQDREKGVLEMPSPAKPRETHREPVEEVLTWLKRLGVHLKKPSAFLDRSAPLTEFQSGVLLCCIVEKVELMRSIPGVTRPPGKQLLSKASSLHNITKALNILQQKKAMPLHLLRRATAIYTGNRDVILQLLLQTRKAYGHHHTRRRVKPLSSAA